MRLRSSRASSEPVEPGRSIRCGQLLDAGRKAIVAERSAHAFDMSIKCTVTVSAAIEDIPGEFDPVDPERD